jgi:hypothetical protein
MDGVHGTDNQPEASAPTSASTRDAAASPGVRSLAPTMVVLTGGDSRGGKPTFYVRGAPNVAAHFGNGAAHFEGRVSLR